MEEDAGDVEPTVKELDAKLQPAILEYFQNADHTDVLFRTEKMNFGHKRPRVVELGEWESDAVSGALAPC